MYIPPTENDMPVTGAPAPTPAAPSMPTGQVPTRKTSEKDLDTWNIAMRASPGYQAFLRNIGQGQGKVKLSRDQQGQLEAVLKQAGIPVPSGMHIDQGGNLNQKNTLVRNVGIAVGLTAATLATAGAAGFGPLAGVMGASAAPAGAATAGAGAFGSTGAGVAGTLGASGIGAGTAAAGTGAGITGAFGSAFGGPGGASAIGGAAPTVAGATGAGTGARVGGSFLSKLVSPNALSAGARGLGAIGQTQANNRGVALDAMMEADKMKLAAGQDRRQDETHIKNLLEGINYSKTDHPIGPPGVSANGKPFTQFSFGPSDATPEDRANNSVLEQQLKARLATVPTLSDYNSKMNPGKTEKAMNWLGPILGFAGAAMGSRGNGSI